MATVPFGDATDFSDAQDREFVDDLLR